MFSEIRNIIYTSGSHVSEKSRGVRQINFHYFKIVNEKNESSL